MLESLTWQAALAVSVDPALIAVMSEQQFLAAVHGQLVLPAGKSQRELRDLGLAVDNSGSPPGHAGQ